MAVVFVLLVIFVAICGTGVFFGAPFVPTRKIWIDQALDLAKISAKDVVVDLGSGDGAVLLSAAIRGAKKAVGYEINPLLVLWSRIRISMRGRKISRKIHIEQGNFFAKNLPSDTTVIYLFQVNKIMKRIPSFIRENRAKFAVNDLKVVCFGFELPGEKIVAKNNGMFLYEF